NLFDAYYRASNVGATKGSGLGLAVVKKFCNTHGADIIVDSKLNEGTTFTLLFPKENPLKND
ncbi:MAG: ATP-binding protein, partial [Ignavibacteria bacterium]